MSSQSQYYYKSIRKNTVQMLNMFNDINIAKYKENGSVDKIVQVPIKLADKEKFYYWIYQRDYVKMLPMMALNLTGMTYDQTRTVDQNQVITTLKDDAVEGFFAPVPYNIDYQLSVATMFISEMDQILEQIVPWFHPCRTLTIELPEIDASYNVKVNVNSITPEHSSELSSEQYRMCRWTINMTSQSYIMKPVRDVNLIRKVYANLYTDVSSGYTETLSLSGNIDTEGNIISTYEILSEMPE